jgi:hypothetical protein
MTELERSAFVSEFCNASRLLPLHSGRFVELVVPDLERCAAKVLHVRFSSKTVLVGVRAGIDYLNLRRLKYASQAELSHDMGPTYQAPFAPFSPSKVPGPVTKTSISCYSGEEVIFLKCHVWDHKHFYDHLQVLEVDVRHVSLSAKVSDRVRRDFAQFQGRSGESRSEWPAMSDVTDYRRRDRSEIVVGQPAKIRTGPNAGLYVYVTEIRNKSRVVGVLLPTEKSGDISDFGPPGEGSYSVTIPHALIPVEMDYWRGTLVRLEDDFIGMVVDYNDGEVLLVSLSNETRQVSRFAILEELEDQRDCLDANGVRVVPGDTLRFSTDQRYGWGIVERVFNGVAMVRPLNGTISDGIHAVPCNETVHMEPPTTGHDQPDDAEGQQDE